MAKPGDIVIYTDMGLKDHVAIVTEVDDTHHSVFVFDMMENVKGVDIVTPEEKTDKKHWTRINPVVPEKMKDGKEIEVIPVEIPVG